MSSNSNPFAFNRKCSEIYITRRFNYTITYSTTVGIKAISVVVIIVAVVVKYNRVMIEPFINTSVAGVFKIVRIVVFVTIVVFRAIFAIIVITVTVIIPVNIYSSVVIASRFPIFFFTVLVFILFPALAPVILGTCFNSRSSKYKRTNQNRKKLPVKVQTINYSP